MARHLVVATVLLGCVAPAPHASEVGAGHIRGLVTAADGGQPIEGARVDVYTSGGRLLDDPGGGIRTAADGTYDVALSGRSPDNDYYVCVDPYGATIPRHSTGYLPVCLGDVAYRPGIAAGDLVHVAPGTTRRHLDMHVPTAAALTVRVTESDGTPIPLAQVYFFPDGSAQGDGASTDEHGRATHTGLQPGGYHVCSPGPSFGVPPGGYRAACYRNAFWPGFAPTGRSIQITAGVGRTVALVLHRLGAASGRITAQASGDEVDSAQLAVFDDRGTVVATVSADRSGRFLAEHLRTGDYVVCARHYVAHRRVFPTGLVAQCTGQVGWTEFGGPPADAVAVHVDAGRVTSGVDIALPAGGAVTGSALTGTVVHVYGPDGDPVGQARVNGRPGEDVGQYTVRVLPGGRYTACFDTGDATSSECFAGVPWAGVPAALPRHRTVIVVRSGRTTGGVSMTGLPLALGD